MARHIRWQKLINWSIQGPILKRLLGYFLMYNAATIVLVVGAITLDRSLSTLSDKDGQASSLTVMQQVRPMLIVVAAMLPVMCWELLKLTNKLAGPLYRLEQEMAHFVRNGQLNQIRLRKDDLATDVVARFNELVEAAHALYPETQPEDPRFSENSRAADSDGRVESRPERTDEICAAAASISGGDTGTRTEIPSVG
jgi:hypothetical protein